MIDITKTKVNVQVEYLTDLANEAEALVLKSYEADIRDEAISKVQEIQYEIQVLKNIIKP
ncbi:uncharacterized protein METZ01_LOCUS157870 [marine metagenome]|jgi:hypothetical protein|uniref:Uncharacterized protein n=1 Tax=marine metagenome TaxID=408172 RepID=A0A382AU01_9ZZZZ|tara:strand:- start:2290 stop:2469 length:180 start_codon:yes stop_codon:yes gene_type:complete